MKITPLNTINNINFSKKLISKTEVRTTEGNRASVNFVEYDPKNRNDQNQLRGTNMLWQPDNGYMSKIYDFFKKAGEDKDRKHKEVRDSWHFYGLENERGDILAAAHTTEIERSPHYRIGVEKTLCIDFIQAHPDEIFSSKNRLYKGLGETLVSKIVEVADEKGRDSVTLDSDNEGFWTESGYFTECNIRGDMPLRRISKDHFSGYINYVETRTKKDPNSFQGLKRVKALYNRVLGS